jgi:hypothetical protein
MCNPLLSCIGAIAVLIGVALTVVGFLKVIKRMYEIHDSYDQVCSSVRELNWYKDRFLEERKRKKRGVKYESK